MEFVFLLIIYELFSKKDKNQKYQAKKSHKNNVKLNQIHLQIPCLLALMSDLFVLISLNPVVLMSLLNWLSASLCLCSIVAFSCFFWLELAAKALKPLRAFLAPSDSCRARCSFLSFCVLSALRKLKLLPFICLFTF